MSAITLESDGGEGGGMRLVLSRSELDHLRIHADLIPFGSVEREEIAQAVMNTLRMAKSPRLRLAAAKCAGALIGLNLKEVDTLLRAKGAGEIRPVNINVSQAVQVNGIDTAKFDALSTDEQAKLLLAATAASTGPGGPATSAS